MLPLLLDSMTVRGISGTSSVHQKVKGAPGVSHGVKGDLRGIQGGDKGGNQVFKGVKNSVRGFPGVEGSLGDPQGLRGASGVY